LLISSTGIACEQEHLLLLISYQQTCMTCTIAVCTVKNSWWWTEERPKHVEFHFKSKFEKLAHLVGFIIRNLSRCTVTWTWICGRHLQFISSKNLYRGNNAFMKCVPLLTSTTSIWNILWYG